MLLGIELKTWLGLSVLGASISTIGSLVGTVLKDYFFTRSIERWKQQQSLEQVYHRYRDPLIVAACELASRTLEILNDYPTVYLRESVWAGRPTKRIDNSVEDEYFQRYKLVSTAYRMSAFLGWLELYRQETTFLHPGNSKLSKSLDTAIGRLRSDLADGQLNIDENWHEWRDHLIFREELRAIGESLIETRGTARTVMGYGRYIEQLESDSPTVVKRWSQKVLNFYIDLQIDGRDFRKIRLQRMFVHLVDLVQLLDTSSLNAHLREAWTHLKPEIEKV